LISVKEGFADCSEYCQRGENTDKNQGTALGQPGPIDFQFSFVATCMYAFVHVLPINLQGV
jgi:hypothetical protein